MPFQKYVLFIFSVNMCVYSICSQLDVITAEKGKADKSNVGSNIQLEIDSVCEVNGTQTGTCQYIKNCPVAVEAIRAGKIPKICDFQENEAIVCCVSQEKPKVPRRRKSSISIRKCKQYERQVCGSSSYTGPKVLTIMRGGRMAESREFPHMAAIGYGDPSLIQWNCSGSLISDRYVLSSAHCTNLGRTLGRARWVRLGDLDVKSVDDDARPEDFKITQINNHPNYKPQLLYNDIALYKLDRPVRFNDYIKPICLHTSRKTPSRSVTATGWGRVGYVHPASDFLTKVNLNLISSRSCSESMKEHRPQVPIDEKSMVCAAEEEDLENNCQGGSGGPLSINGKKCIPKQVGITSVGSHCTLPDFPGIYTRIAHFSPWIESIVWPNNKLDRRQ